MTEPGTVAAAFRDAVIARDPEAMEAVLAEDVVFRSPAVHQPYAGRVATMVVLRSVLRVLEDFGYERAFATEDGSGHVLEFVARVGAREVQGVDMLATAEGPRDRADRPDPADVGARRGRRPHGRGHPRGDGRAGPGLIAVPLGSPP
ncbi:nuclear transport factor 2 family protein [Nocardioides marmoribigeumensis]|uniref:SnoaL-like domain-containing protein n=1 Tax=Nocardioides marmoribigeumensis TaxID=433649 RepID=A0ABU2C0D1_9ACTN|nr:nuclear transport factor 2 family protein [Nocardioides marmoribigeumensis]MDR7364124.1 hypothetical protein [Nocardioides marmoribigeumensis]